ncbi:MAG: ferredoxin [Candidatus Micrarchaeia archaeon]
MAKYKIEHERPNCIGCSACVAVCPKFWFMGDDGKTSVTGAKRLENGWEELEILEENVQCNKQAADSCPVNVIHLTNLDTGEKIT